MLSCPTPALLRRLVVLLMVVGAPVLRAQQLPTPDQARRLLETRPDLVAQLRREIASSGLTADQIRARLRAEGYPEDLLDAYIGPRRVGQDSISGIAPTEDVLDAVAALGMSDSVDTSELRTMLRDRRRGMSLSDTLPRTSDSLSLDRRDTTDMLLIPGEQLRDTIGGARRTTRQRGVSVARIQPRRVVPDSGFTIFGLNVFDRTTTQFDPNLGGPVDANYRIGPGDRLVLIITGDAERAFTLDVAREGFIFVPGVGEIPVANLSLGQLEDVLYQKLGRVFSGLRRGAGATSHFSLSVARLHSNQVFVLGDVTQPGSYRISSVGTALTALYAAGGPTRNGSMRRVEIRRGGRLVDSLDLYDYFLHADGSHDPRLQSGDVIFVPVHGPRVRIHGEVVRPATYEVHGAESLADALRSAGGFTPEAARRRVQISRILPPSQRDTSDRARVVVDISSEQFGTGTGPAYPLEAGDVIRVFAVDERVGRRIVVRGNVWTPGVVGYTPGMKLSDAVHQAGGLKPNTYLGQVLVSRLRESDSMRVQLRTAFDRRTGHPTEDIPLRDDDEIRIFAVSEFRTPEYVAITGAVRRPGRVPYREGMTLRDLVLLAGGLEQRAYVGEAEIARLPASRDGGRLAVSERVMIDSSYLFAEESSPSVRQSGMPASAPSRVATEVPLEPFDNVLILAQPDWERPRRVTLTGEVRYPGTYTLTKKGDRLGDVLERAGGLTQGAYAGGVVFYRHQGRAGRIGVDLSRVLKDADFRDNLLLQDGDSIHLPPFDGLVNVSGAVNAPRAVAYVPGADLNYYVRAAGGPSRLAEPSRAYVTQPDGTVESLVERTLLPDVVPVPRPGSTVVVTEKDLNEHSDTIARLGVLAQVLGGVVTLVAILHRP
ncbi:MAG: polysaccharide export protein [Gemmatimonadetes bacterium]|nr:polysaccharide export protein [Gemmatimonadota bacterium]